MIRLRAGDVLAVVLPLGQRWRELVPAVWSAGAALMPLDPRLASAERRTLLRLGRPTALLDGEGLRRLRGGVPAAEGLALVIASSGTGGLPRLVELSRSTVEHAVRASAEALGAERSDDWLACLPPAHIGGLLVLLRAMLLGAPLKILDRFDPADFAAICSDQPPAFTALVPTMLRRLLEARIDLAGFRAILVGGADLDHQLAAAGRAAGARAIETYGQTESCGGVVYGGRPLSGVRLRLGASGEIELAGPTVMRGYRLDPQSTARSLSADGWLRTGDAGSLDDTGRLRVEGRLDDLILTGGERVWPAEVESALGTHPEVAEVAVAGHPDSEWGMRVVATVVPRTPGSPPTLAALRDHVATSLARYKAPTELHLVRQLPRAALGKLRRRPRETDR